MLPLVSRKTTQLLTCSEVVFWVRWLFLVHTGAFLWIKWDRINNYLRTTQINWGCLWQTRTCGHPFPRNTLWGHAELKIHSQISLYHLGMCMIRGVWALYDNRRASLQKRQDHRIQDVKGIFNVAFLVDLVPGPFFTSHYCACVSLSFE